VRDEEEHSNGNAPPIMQGFTNIEIVDGSTRCVCGHALDEHFAYRYLWACGVKGCACPNFEEDEGSDA